MRNRLFTALFASAFVFAACAGGNGSSGAPTTGTGATMPPAGTTGPADTTAAFDPSTITGDVRLGAWESSPAEGLALKAALDGFAAKYPNIKVTQETVAGDYRVQMVTNFGSGDVPDIFYINAEYAPEWMAEGFLEPLDDYIAKQGFDTSAFFPGYADVFKSDGKTYGLPKDGNTIAMGYNTDLVTTPPATLAELVTAADGLKGKGDLKAPICVNPGLDRGLAFLYAEGGSLLTADGTASAIETDASKAAVQWYLDLIKNGQAMTPSQLGDGWCGEAIGKGDVAIAFEGGWLKGALTNDFPDTKWAFAEMPAGSAGKATITFTAAYGIAADSENKDAAWVVLQYLTGPEGMQKWTEGGIAVPSRSDVPVPEGFDVIVKGADYAKPGSGFMPSYNDVQKAFQDAFTAEVTNETYSADAVVTATKAAIDKALK
ncbi:MAG TPA: extracellular solute-binding protein [Candidatus Limnocylindria bacterium]|nr:extracellular solute-binding protein [Candidatus Limnocylindria bacterium]